MLSNERIPRCRDDSDSESDVTLKRLKKDESELSYSENGLSSLPSSLSSSPAPLVTPRRFEKTALRKGDEGVEVIAPNGYQNLRFLPTNGTFGEIILAEHSYHKKVVIKKQAIDSDFALEAAYRELRNLVHITTQSPSPYIIGILDTWMEPGGAYIVEERLDTDLGSWMKRNRQNGRSPTAGVRQKIAIAVLGGISHLHACNIIHRDFKPENICLTEDLSKIQLVDLGSCAKFHSKTATKQRPLTHGNLVCTYSYRAPEICGKLDSYTMNVDCWSAGCIVAELLGKVLFSRPEADLAAMHDAFFCIPSFEFKFPTATDLELVLLKSLLKKDPKERMSAKNALQLITKTAPQQLATPFHPPDYCYEDMSEMRRLLDVEVASAERLLAF